MLKMLQRADGVVQTRFERVQALHGSHSAILMLMLIGSGMGGAAMFYPYAVIALIQFMKIRGQDPVLVMLFLILYVAIGTVQGVWLGAACGAAAAFRAHQKRQKAGMICWLGSLPYLLLLIWYGFHCAAAPNTISAFLFLCGLPLLWAILLLFIGTWLLYSPSTYGR